MEGLGVNIAQVNGKVVPALCEVLLLEFRSLVSPVRCDVEMCDECRRMSVHGH